MKSKFRPFSFGVVVNNAISVVGSEASYSYKQLALFSECLAESLRARCVSNDSPVGLIFAEGVSVVCE